MCENLDIGSILATGIVGSAALVAPIAIVGGGIYSVVKLANYANERFASSTYDKIKNTAGKIAEISIKILGGAFAVSQMFLPVIMMAASVGGVYKCTHEILFNPNSSTLKDLTMCSIFASAGAIVTYDLGSKTLDFLRS